MTASALRNHGQPLALDVFEWIAAAWPGSYGLMYIAPEHPDADGEWRFHVRKIGGGHVEDLEDRYFESRA